MACPLFPFPNPGWLSLTSLPQFQNASPRLTLAGPAQPYPHPSVVCPSPQLWETQYLSEAGLWTVDAVIYINKAKPMS